MKRIEAAAARQVPINARCAIKRQKQMVKRIERSKRILEEVQRLFEAGYPVYVNR